MFDKAKERRSGERSPLYKLLTIPDWGCLMGIRTTGDFILICSSCVVPASAQLMHEGEGAFQVLASCLQRRMGTPHAPGGGGGCPAQGCFVNMLLHLFLRGLRGCQAGCDMRKEEAPSLYTQEEVLCLGFLLALCVCQGDISQHTAKIAECHDGGPELKEVSREKIIFEQQCTIYTLYLDLWVGMWVQFRNTRKACGRVVTSTHLAQTWWAVLLTSEFVGSEVTKKNF